MWGYVIILVVAASAGVFGVWKYNHAIEQAVKAQREVAEAKKVVEDWSVTYAHLNSQYVLLNKTLSAKTRAANQLRKNIDGLQTELAELRNKSPEVQIWGDQPVPESVANVLRNNAVTGAPETGRGPGAVGSVGQNAPSGITIKDKP